MAYCFWQLCYIYTQTAYWLYWGFCLTCFIIWFPALANHNFLWSVLQLIGVVIYLDMHVLIPAPGFGHNFMGLWVFLRMSGHTSNSLPWFLFYFWCEFCIFDFWFYIFLFSGAYHFTFICLTDEPSPGLHGQYAELLAWLLFGIIFPFSLSLYIYIYVYMCMYVYICVFWVSVDHLLRI